MLGQIRHSIALMHGQTEIGHRNRALKAFRVLTVAGARGIASMQASGPSQRLVRSRIHPRSLAR